MEINLPLFAGLLAAILHVITGPDHLAAVLPFAIESKRRAWKVGLLWGIGHLIGMGVIGLLFVFLKDYIPVEPISHYSELLVGFVLIGIGIASLYYLLKKRKKHKHLHVHAESVPVIHEHEHRHNGKNHQHDFSLSMSQSNRAALLIGILHGLAGIAHFLLFLPVLGFESRLQGITYVLGFAAGIVIAMIVFAVIVGRIAQTADNQNGELFYKGIRLAAGIIAIVVGVYWCTVTI